MAKASEKNKVLCEFCGKRIPQERLEILPGTTTCVKCSQAIPYSEAEVIGLKNGEPDEASRLNMEDYEELEGDLSLPNEDNW